jgi:hypothetical protein
MPDDQRLRQELIRFADEVPVDTDDGLGSVLATGRARIRRRRTAALLAVPVAVALVVVTVVVWAGAGGPRDRTAPASPPSRITGTWQRAVVAEDSLPAEASGTWTMVLTSDGGLTLVAPDAWTTGFGQPTGVYRRSGDALRTNVFASELCGGAAGAYSFTADLQRLDLAPSSEPCTARRAVLAGTWERAP